MTGIMAAVAGGTQNVIYAAGLYNSSVGTVDTSPIDFSASSAGGATLSYNYTWAGYYRPATTGTVTLGLATSYQEYLAGYGAFNWGGGGSTVAYFWLGPNAVSNPTVGNANITSNNNTATYAPSLVAGINYPVRINLIMSLPYQYPIFTFYQGYADGAFNFQSNGSTAVTNLIWYNTKTNGF